MNKAKATNQNCFFYNKEYNNYCKACTYANCRECNLFIAKTDKRQIELDRKYQEQRELEYYPNGVRK